MLKSIKLSIKSNYCIRPIADGLDFLGVVIYNKYTKLRKTIKKMYIHKISNLCDNKVIVSYNGWLVLCNSHSLKNKYESKRKCYDN